MRKRVISFFVIMLFNIVFVLPPLSAGTWERVNSTSDHWPSPKTTEENPREFTSYALDMVEFEAHTYVGTRYPDEANDIQLWQTSDFEQWEPINITKDFPNDNLMSVQLLAVHDKHLFAFCKIKPGNSQQRFRQIYRSSDGTNWEKIPSDEFRKGTWEDAVSFEEYLYVSGTNENILRRITGNFLNPTWEHLLPEIEGGNRARFAKFNNDLYMVRIDPNATNIEIWKKPGKSDEGDEMPWVKTLMSSPIPKQFDWYGQIIEIDKYNFTIFESTLYFSYGRIYRLLDQTWEEDDEIEFEKNFHMFTVHDELYTKMGADPSPSEFLGATFRLINRNSEDNWEPILEGTPDCTNLPAIAVVTREDMDYMLLGNIWKYKKGAISLSPTMLTSINLEPGMTDVPMLQWSVEFNVSETIREITIENTRTAEAGHEIESLKLYRSSPTLTETFVVELIPKEDQKTWETPSDFHIDLTKGDIFTIKMDIKGRETARHGKTVQLAIPENTISWTVNSTFIPSQVVSLLPLTINVPGVYGIRNMTPLLPSPIKQGSTGINVLIWEVDFFAGETINEFSVKNWGTAESGIDIHRVSLYRTNGAQSEKEIEFLPQPDYKTWLTPPSFKLTLHDNDRYIITADISDDARVGRTVQLGIPAGSFAWETNEFFTLGTDLIAFDASTITLNAPVAEPDPIPETIIFPNPARDEVWFMYDLNTAADIHINIFNPTGALVSEIREHKGPGPRAQTMWNAANKAPGMYIAIIKIQESSGSFRQFKRKVYIKK